MTPQRNGRGQGGWAAARRRVLVGASLLAMLAPLAWARAGAATARSAGVRASASRPGSALHVIPFPGTPDASSQSRIIFSSLAPSDLRSVTVRGSSSGLHPGHLLRLPDQAGTEFVPAHGFSPGETVTVQALLTSAKAGGASGDGGAKVLQFSFAVAVVPAAPGVTARSAQAGAVARSAQARGRMASPPHHVFRSAPRLQPPLVHVSSGPAPGSRDIFVSPRPATRARTAQQGVMILNPRGQLVWFREAEAPFNLEMQTYRRHPVLTWFQLGRHGGEDVILNRSYRPVSVLHAGWGYASDEHEFQLTPQGTALVDAYAPVQADLSSVGGPKDGTMLDCIIQELDVRTGAVLWEWHALGHVALTASYRTPSGGSYEPYHLNSIQQLGGHRLLVSLHNTWAAYEIDQRTGHVIWTLGGKRSSFRMGRGTNFEWQHDTRLHDHGLLTLFDDGASASGGEQEPQSSAKELKLDLHDHTVSLVHRFRHSPPLLSGTQGNAQLLYNRDVFVGWGSEPDFSQYTPDGRQVFSASFPLGLQSYRAYRFPWTGHPAGRPALALSRGAHGTRGLYASWNGATQVAAWRVLGGQRRGSLRALTEKTWTGFETAIALHQPERYVAVQALDSHGHVLRRSPVRATRSARAS